MLIAIEDSGTGAHAVGLGREQRVENAVNDLRQIKVSRESNQDVNGRFITLCTAAPGFGARGPLAGLAQIKEPGLRGGEAGGGGELGRVTDRRDRSLEKAFFSRDVGRFIWLHCSASSASLVHVRAMSSRMPCNRMLGVRSAICRQSAARSLHSAGVNMATTPHLEPGLTLAVKVGSVLDKV